MKVTPELAEHVRPMLKASPLAAKPLGEASKALQGLASLAAWHVGVVTPGFIAVLLGGQTLAKQSHLPLDLSAGVLILAESAFLLDIVAGMLTLGGLVKAALDRGIAAARLSSLAAVLESGLTTGELPDDIEKQLKRAVEDVEKLASVEPVVVANITGTINAYGALVAYALLAILVAAQYVQAP